MKNTSFKAIIVFTLTTFFLIITVGFVTLKRDHLKSLYQGNFDYFGTNSLFIEKNGGLKFNWITTSNDTGVFEFVTQDNSVIKKGRTAPGRVHSFFIDHKLKENVIFRFGGENESLSEVKLRPISLNEKSVFKNVDSLYVVGDVHGRYKQLINLLQKSFVINSELKWIAGESNLVFLGDLFDRGDDVTKVLWFIYDLEEKAEAAGGKVHLVLGNHEIMTMTNDLRYIGRKEASLPIAYGTTYDYMFHPTKSFLGSWLSSKPSVIRIDKAIFAHGGIVDLETNSIDQFNQRVHTYMKDPMFLDIVKDHPDSLKYDSQDWQNMKYFFYNEDSPFWYRGYVYSDTLEVQLNSMLRKYQSKIHVVAHTPLQTITQKYKGKLLTTDLNEAATQLLLLVRKRNKYSKYKIDSAGTISELD